MANIEVKHLDAFDSKGYIKCKSEKGIDIIDYSKADNNYIRISGYTAHSEEYFLIDLDISTAIKLAKTLRTEINKAKEGVENGN